jgi:serine/threonine-protein kinase
LRVAARTSSFQFRGAAGDVRTIGDRLNVRTVLEGSVRVLEDRVRITAQLVDARDGFQIWGERYDRELADIFSVQEEIAREIVEHLRAELVGRPGDAGAPLVRSHSEDLEAYTLYLKGRYLWNKRTADGLRDSIECFEQAIEVDPDYALAYAGLADAYSLLGWYRYLTADEAYERIKQAAGKALQLEAGVPEARTSQAYAKFIYEWDFPGADSEFLQAIELNPGYPTVHHWYGEYLMAMGRLKEANAQLQLAHDLDPLSLTISVGLGWSHYFLGQYDQAIERYESVVAMDPYFVIMPWFLGPAYLQAGRHEDAIALFDEWIGRLGPHPGLVALLAQSHALAGREDEARAVYAQLEEQAKRAPIFPDYRALVHTSLGETDEAFGWLEKALEERCWVLVFLAVDPAYGSLRSDPRFAALTERIGLPETVTP